MAALTNPSDGCTVQPGCIFAVRRCRWWAGGPAGRYHLLKLEPWIASRAAQHDSQGDAWIAWAARQAAAAQEAPP